MLFVSVCCHEMSSKGVFTPGVFFFCQRSFYIVFLCSRALLENVPGVFLNASLCAFFSRTERIKKLKKVQLSEKKRLTSGAFLTADQSQFAANRASSKQSSWTMMVGTLLLPSPGDICTHQRAGTRFSSSSSVRANARACF